ncbi:MAG TPA: hypothetical protein VGG14_17225 [Candidatus Sulfotelmatobacter sp.]
MAKKQKRRNSAAKKIRTKPPKAKGERRAKTSKRRIVPAHDSDHSLSKNEILTHNEISGPLQYPFSPSAVISAEVALVTNRATPEDAQVVRDNILLGHRDEIAYILEEYWPQLGWQLEVLRNPAKGHTPDSLMFAFEPLCGRDREFLFGPLLRPTSVPSTCLQVRKTLNELKEQRKKLAALRVPIEAQTQKCEEKRRAVQQASDKNRAELSKEIVRRRGVLLHLRNEYQECECLMSKSDAGTQSGDDVRKRYAKLTEEIAADERVVRDFKKNYDNATPQNWAWAKEVAAKHEAELSILEARARDIRAEIVKLEERYGDEGAGFARQDLLIFIAKRRCRHHPRQYARAIAGLPDLPSRESFGRCARFASKRDPHKNFEIFQVFARAWARRDSASTDREKRMQLFRDEIARIPQTRLFHNERVLNYIRKFFEDNDRDICEAITFYLAPHPEPGRIPYLITSRLLRNITDKIEREAGLTDLERVLTERKRGKP